MTRIQVFSSFLLRVFIASASALPLRKLGLVLNDETTPSFLIIKNQNPNKIVSQIEFHVGAQKVSAIDDMVMVYVPKGGFPMGSNDGSQDERPVHLVYLDAFWIDQTEVTNTQYARCVDDGICDLPADPTQYYIEESADHPVVYVDWKDANTYCQWAGRRLPTEAEWEKAARGTDSRTFPWGNDGDCSRANFWDCPQFETTSPVGFYGERGVSPFGTHDMAGNVWEWVFDWYASDYYQYSPTRNPTGPASGIYHVWRGGSWNCNQTSARSVERGNFNPDYWRDLIGFRCAMSPTQP
jgi:eukaryotic-like serine/threonine-protein kinase